jgi:hypothetical protein
MTELHKHLSDTAIKLSVYSSVLDFGLAVSVAFLPKNGSFGFLISIFTSAITYVTLAIIALFIAAFVLKYKEKVVKIYTNTLLRQSKLNKWRKMTVYSAPNIPIQEDERKAVMRVPSNIRINDLAVQHVVNRKNESFIRFNGVWYKSDKNKFEKVSKPNYD